MTEPSPSTKPALRDFKWWDAFLVILGLPLWIMLAVSTVLAERIDKLYCDIMDIKR